MSNIQLEEKHENSRTMDDINKKYVIFQLGDEEYGLDILKVQEIISYKNVTKLPNVPKYVKGVLNLRGKVIPVIDLRLKFEMTAKDNDQFTVIIVTEINNKVVGLIVDTVESVVNLKMKDVDMAPDIGTNVNMEFIRGMGKVDNKLIILLDMDKILTAKELQGIHARKEEITEEEG